MDSKVLGFQILWWLKIESAVSPSLRCNKLCIAKAYYTTVIGMYTHAMSAVYTSKLIIIIIIIPGMFKTLHFNTTLMCAQHHDRMCTL